LRTNGELSWMKSFIVRDCPDPEGEFQDLQGLVASTSADGSTVVTSKFQIGFTESDPPVAIPIWSLAVLDPQGEQQSEHIRDARTGELLVRRQVVKYFTPPGTIPVRGTVYGMSPPWWDAYASPQNTESYVQNPIDGSVVRNQQGGGVIATANPAGFFTARIPQENATLSFSLEHGICSPGPDGGAGTYDRTLWVVLSDGGRRPIELGPEEDANGDGVLDITISQPAEVNFRPVFNTVANGQSVARAWALQAHRHAREMFDFVQDTDAKFSLGDSFRGIEPLELRPMSSGTVQDYWHAGAGGELPARVYTSVQYLRRRGPRTDVESFTYDAVPTVFSHELGHHMVYSLTGTRENDNRQAEEGVADVLTAFTNNDARIGFHADGPAGVTEFSFSLGMDDEVRTPLRADVGDAFWLLRGYLPVERITPDTAEGLLLHWLHAHWAPEGDPMRFDAWNGTIFDELLAIAANPPFCQTAGCATAGYDKAIVKAFRGRGSLFDAPFIRGDANVDQQVDISDAIKILDILFVGFGQYVDCWNAVDVDNDGQANITDAIYLLLKLFQGGASIPPPSATAGWIRNVRATPETWVAPTSPANYSHQGSLGAGAGIIARRRQDHHTATPVGRGTGR